MNHIENAYFSGQPSFRLYQGGAFASVPVENLT